MRPLTHWSRRLATAVLVLAACRGDRNTLTVAGTIEIRQVQLASLAAGRLRLLHHDEGDTVRAGDTIAMLDQRAWTMIEQRGAQAGAARLRVGSRRGRRRQCARRERPRPGGRLRAADIISLQQYGQIRSAAAAFGRLQAVRAAPRESKPPGRGGGRARFGTS
jgi:multidrug efflux pump subunit AcrA (membrane-fusion protein)